MSQKDHFKGQKILVVEDNPISFKLISVHMVYRNLTVIHADDGLEALAKFENTPDLEAILMDIQLPNINGLELTKIIRRTNQEIPIIAITANVLDDDRIACIEAGCSDFISKPVNFDELFKILKQYLD